MPTPQEHCWRSVTDLELLDAPNLDVVLAPFVLELLARVEDRAVHVLLPPAGRRVRPLPDHEHPVGERWPCALHHAATGPEPRLSPV